MKYILLSIAFFIILFSYSCKKNNNSSSTSSTVTICNQVWMTKNLGVSNYRNGDPIPQVSDYTAWSNLTTGAWCYSNNDSTLGPTYGKLYNWYAVNDSRGLAPTGWHIPSDAEWSTLSTCLGGDLVASGALKEVGTTHWLSPNTGASNSSGFTALPGGLRIILGNFNNTVGTDGYWWSSSENSSNYAWKRQLDNYYRGMFRDTLQKKYGASVRCVKD